MRRMNFVEYIRMYNPFGFVDENRVPRYFKDRRTLYMYVIKRLYEYYSDGIIDPVTFLHVETHMPLRDCEHVVKRNCDVLENGYVHAGRKRFVAWLYISNLLQCFHTISQTKFEKDEFEAAFNMCKELFTDDDTDENNNKL